MNAMMTIGVLVLVGFLAGQLARLVRLPKVTGYILAGIAMNPRLFHLVPEDFATHADLVTNIALCFITFSVGGTLLYPQLKRLGKAILWITVLEAEAAFLVVIAGFALLSPLLGSAAAAWAGMLLPLSLLLGALASPTDPSATLAVVHEYNAKGEVSSTIMGVAAFDDAFGIINYSLAVGAAQVLVLHEGFSLSSSVLRPLLSIAGSVAIGAAAGFVFNRVAAALKCESEGSLIVVVAGMLTLCFGIARALQCDELLSTMVMGCVVVNFNPCQEKIFRMLERYTEELIFVIFFTISGMQLDFAALFGALPLVLVFVALRAAGKFAGTMAGSGISKASPPVRRYTAFGLIPQGGIVIGLALMIKGNPAFHALSDTLIGVVIGATVIHEIVGPILSETALKRAGEIAAGGRPS